MTKERLIQTIQLYLKKGAKRTDFLRKTMGGCGENVSFFPKVMPLYPELIRFHNNVVVASNVSFGTHDAIHVVLNQGGYGRFTEAIGCIEIMDNVFIGMNTTILYGVRIGENCIIGANSLINKDLEPNGVYVGIPARKICSFDDYIKKRANLEMVDVKVSQHISREEIASAWEIFERKHQ